MPHVRPNVKELSKRYYFTIAIFLCIVLAETAPWIGAQEGPLFPDVTVKYVAVTGLFFSSGLALTEKDLCKNLRRFRLHLFVLSISFGLCPVFILIFLSLYECMFELNTWIYNGFMIAACLPPPVSLAVVLTRSAGGNEAVAVWNSALALILGALLTPVLLLVYIRVSTTFPVVESIFQLVQTVLIPLLLGNVSRLAFRQETLSRLPFKLCGQIFLLFIIYCSFCDMFNQEDYTIDAHIILITVLLVVLIQMNLMFLVFKISHIIGKREKLFSSQDIIAITFCATEKSLFLGLPILKVLYSGYSHLTHTSLPLLIYHAVQLILGSFFVPYLKKWLKRQAKAVRPFKSP